MQPRTDVIATLFRGLGEQPARTAPFAVDGAAPRAVLLPHTVENLQEALRIAQANKLTVAPRGGGTVMELGNRPKQLDLVIGTTHLAGPIDHRPTDMTVTVPAGVTIKHLQETLAQHGQFLPLDVPLPARATVGGMLAANLMGAHRQAYGTARDWLIGIQLVHADGTLTRAGGQVVKNVTGYDMNKLYVGSLGTLGIIVEATFKVSPIPAVRRTFAAQFTSIARACQAALHVAQSGIGPLACAVVDIGARRRIEAMMPILTLDDALLLVEIGGRPSAVERRQRQLTNLLESEFSAVPVEVEADSAAIWQYVTDMGWSTEDLPVFSLRFLTSATNLPSVYPQVREALHLESYSVGTILQPQFGSMRSIGWPQPGADPAPQDIADWVAAFRTALARNNGHVLIERASPPLKHALDVWGEPPESIAIMRRIKAQFDPSGTLNPGRFVGGI